MVDIVRKNKWKTANKVNLYAKNRRKTKMSNKTIVQILKKHSINYRIDETGHIFADNGYTYNGEWFDGCIDVTGWSRQKLYSWLGY